MRIFETIFLDAEGSNNIGDLRLCQSLLFPSLYIDGCGPDQLDAILNLEVYMYIRL
jgi:hypothetical protein